MTATTDIPAPIATDAPAPDDVGEEVRHPGTKLYDVVAVTHDGAVICRECANPEYVSLARESPREIPHGGPVDRGTEWDCPGPACDNCHRRITSVSILHYDGVCDPECSETTV